MSISTVNHPVGTIVELPVGRGVIRWSGNLSNKPGKFFGVELYEANGKNDGSFEGHPYFRCPPNCGLFVRNSNIKAVVGIETPPEPVKVRVNCVSCLRTLNVILETSLDSTAVTRPPKDPKYHPGELITDFITLLALFQPRQGSSKWCSQPFRPKYTDQRDARLFLGSEHPDAEVPTQQKPFQSTPTSSEGCTEGIATLSATQSVTQRPQSPCVIPIITTILNTSYDASAGGVSIPSSDRFATCADHDTSYP